MKKNPWIVVVVLLLVFGAGFMLMFGAFWSSLVGTPQRLQKASILRLELEGVIIDGKDFLEDLHRYAERDEVKALMVDISSPGGVVGASQELYRELKRIREELKKPVVVASHSLLASGAYYAALGADRIVVNPGAIVGSIGVIMEFANLESLFEWAKIDRYVIKSGAFKDAGAVYRPMKPVERELFQNMIDEVLDQFKRTVGENRGLSEEEVDLVADGRIMTGETAQRLGLVDQLGTSEDALRTAAELAGLGADPHVFEPPKHGPGFFEIFQWIEEDKASAAAKMMANYLGLELLGKPLYLMPGTLLGLPSKSQ